MNLKAMILNKVKAPSFLIKMGLISILFIFAINIEMGVVISYSEEITGKNEINVLLFIAHIFSYFEMYSKYFLIGLIILIPDILHEPYLTETLYLKNRDRWRLFKNTISIITIYILLFILWFIVLTIVFSLFRLRIFDISWPQNLMDEILKLSNNDMALINIPHSATAYPLIISLILIIIKVFLGFFVISLAAFYISFKKQNVGYGIALAVILYVISDLLFYYGNIKWNLFNNLEHTFKLDTIAYKYSLCTFFVFENIEIDFIDKIIHSYIYGIILSIIFMILIRFEIKNKDLC